MEIPKNGEPIIQSTIQAIGINRTNRDLESPPRRIGSYWCYIPPAVTLLSSVFTTMAVMGWGTSGNREYLEKAVYGGYAIAGGVGLAIIVTGGEMIAACREYACIEARSTFERSWSWLKKKEGVMINTLCASSPITWLCLVVAPKCNHKEKQPLLGRK